MLHTRRKVFQNVPKCPKMSRNVRKCPLQTHPCPNGLVQLLTVSSSWQINLSLPSVNLFNRFSALLKLFLPHPFCFVGSKKYFQDKMGQRLRATFLFVLCFCPNWFTLFVYITFLPFSNASPVLQSVCHLSMSQYFLNLPN